MKKKTECREYRVHSLAKNAIKINFPCNDFAISTNKLPDTSNMHQGNHLLPNPQNQSFESSQEAESYVFNQPLILPAWEI